MRSACAATRPSAVEEAADFAHGSGTLVRGAPRLDRGAGRGGRVLGIERQQDDLVGAESRNLSRNRLGKRTPVAHGDETSRLPAGQLGRKAGVERRRLGLRLWKQWRTAAHVGVVGAGLLPATAGDQPGEQRPQRPRQADDGAVVEQVEEERFDGGEAVGTAEVEQDDRQATQRRAVTRRRLVNHSRSRTPPVAARNPGAGP